MHPLRMAFDTREGLSEEGKVQRAPMHLTQHMVRKLRNDFVGKDDVERYQALRDDGFYDIGLSTRFFSSLVKQYEQAVEDILPYAQAHLPKPIVDDMPIYVGENALDLNIDVVDEITQAYLQGENVSEFDYEKRSGRDCDLHDGHVQDYMALRR